MRGVRTAMLLLEKQPRDISWVRSSRSDATFGEVDSSLV